MDIPVEVVPLSREIERLYLSYAVSVITQRALPDVRDGLKPVQRRILFAMHHELHLSADAKPKKCAAIVGDVMGKYHPHGDSAIYEALVRMAQDWVLRAPLVRGQGNFGSLDGDPAAAMRYTEARLTPIAGELLLELPKKTVPYRPNYDGTRFEPQVLPARFPNLLVNGVQGIAVGMATSIPPHNLGEVIDACVALIGDPTLTTKVLLTKIKGPDFPTGGELLSSRAELLRIYETGQGAVRIRAEWKLERDKRSERLVITSIPYGLERATIVEKIADVILGKKLPSLLDVRDESTQETRIVLETKGDANPELVMAYLCKHTPLSTSVQVNMTCLVPSKNPEVPTPERLDLRSILKHFLNFRLEVVTKRLEFELAEINSRLHILAGFEKVFDALDAIIKLIRASEGKRDAAEKIMKRFAIDSEQTEAILELKLYRLARLEILIIQKEAKEKRLEAKRLTDLLKSEGKRWKLVEGDLLEIQKAYADKRRTRIVRSLDSEPEFSAEDFIVDEDSTVILTRQGWVKRQQTVKDLSTTRVREGDEVLTCQAGSAKAAIAFFSNHGVAYVARIADLPQSSGYGDPIQKLFNLADGERVIASLSFDPRLLEVPEAEEEPKPPFAIAVTERGLAFRFSLRTHREPSTRAGRRFARLNEDDAVLAVFSEQNVQYIVAASDDGHGIAVDREALPTLGSAGKGSMLIKLGQGVRLLASIGVPSPRIGSLVAFTSSGRRFELFAEALLASRGARGKALVKTTGFAKVERPLPLVPDLGLGGHK